MTSGRNGPSDPGALAMLEKLPVTSSPSRQDGGTRLGWLTATPDFLASIPREALSRALRIHHRAITVEGEPFQTRHSYEGNLFRLRTNADRSRTDFRLDGEP